MRNDIDRLWWMPLAFAMVLLSAYLWLMHREQHACIAFGRCSGFYAVLRLPAMRYVATGFALVMGLVAALKFHANGERGRLLARQNEIGDLRNMDWQAFERLVSEAYRRAGFAVQENGQGGADGGIDLFLRRGGRTSIVQIKHWKANKVGAPIVRELYGLMHHHSAQEAKVVTVGTFTSEAWEFAKGKPIELVSGERLFSLIQTVKDIRE